MSFTTIKSTQNKFLEEYLRGTGRKISAAEAKQKFGIMNLSARMSELRKSGLRVTSDVNTTGRTVYTVSARDVNGSRARVFA